MSSAILAYIPVLHEGYRIFLSRHSEATACCILGKSVLDLFPVLKKDIRCLDPNLVASAIKGWDICHSVSIIEHNVLPTLSRIHPIIIMPDEDISHELAERYFPEAPVSYDSIFLRWDKKRSTEPTAVSYDRRMTPTTFENELLFQTRTASEKSSDWWRRVGAALVKDGKVINIAYNHHSPSHAPYRDGDPRMHFPAGTSIEYTTAEHAEAVLIGDAACYGVTLKGADLYTTTFPCPACAKLIGRSGIRRCFYQDGYAAIDAEIVLKDHNIEIILIE